MKKNIIASLTAAAIMIVVFLAFAAVTKPRELGSIKAGFLYIADASTAYTENFLRAQEDIEEELGGHVQCVSISNVPEEDAAKYIQQLVDEGCGIIFGTSYGYEDAMRAAAAEYPDIQFCQATGDNTEGSTENYHTFMGRISEGRYVSGVAAGLQLRELIEDEVITENEALIGYVAAFPSPEVISGYTAFFLGVRSVCPPARMNVRYTDTWDDTITEKHCAGQLIKEGCIIISQHSDTTGPAVACEAAQSDLPVYLVSYNETMIDVAPTSALTGCRINWEPYETAAIRAVLEGKSIESCLPANVTVNGRDAGAGFAAGWVEMLDLNRVIAADDTEETLQQCIESFKNGRVEIFKGNYTGTDPNNEADTVDLSGGWEENASASAPSFHYVLDDVITVEDD